jgi:DNA modification methylase
MSKASDLLWPASSVESWPIGHLIPYARNSRRHSEQQINQIAASITQFGFTVPVLAAEDGTIIAGHGRVLAAKELGLADLPVMVARGWSEEQRRAYTIADNKLTENGEWDDELLKLEIGELRGSGFDIELLGFDAKAIEQMLDFAETDGQTDEEAIPEPASVIVSRPGDIWILGHHRIICGDCTDAETVSKVLGNTKPHLMVTDPPYGVAYDPTWRARAGVNKNRGKMGKVLNDERADWREAWALFPGDVGYVWHGGLHAAAVASSLAAAGFEVRSQIIWAKDRFALSRGDYHWQHEPAWYCVRKGATGRWSGDRSQSTLWEIPAREDSGVGHGTQKPIECMRRPMINNSEPGDAVYEPFSGSGTTIIAGETIGRRVFAVELDPGYVDIAVRRWEEFTKKAAIHADSGQSFWEALESLPAERNDAQVG